MSINMEITYPRELEKAKKEGWPLLIPVGTMEYHSDHCPYGCDTLVTMGIAREVAKKIDAVILPPVWYGVASYAVGGPEKNTIQVDCDTFEAYIYNILKSLFKSGFTRKIYILIGHQTEDYLPMTLACMKAAKKLTFEYLEETQGAGWWGNEKTKDFYKTLGDGESPWNWIRVIRVNTEAGIPGDHAGKYESEWLEALFPDIIKKERIMESGDWFSASAVNMNMEEGEEAVRKMVDRVVEVIKN